MAAGFSIPVDFICSGITSFEFVTPKAWSATYNLSEDKKSGTLIITSPSGMDGRPYEILGVLPGSSGTALIQADRDTKAVINRVTLHITGKESRQEAVRRFSGSTGIQGTLLPLHLYGIFSEALLRITAAFFLLYLLSGIFRKADGLFPLLVGILSAAACIWILDIRIRIPGDMLPSQWSDFAFWTETAEQ